MNLKNVYSTILRTTIKGVTPCTEYITGPVIQAFVFKRCDNFIF